jgi:hypothetical protein
MMQYVKTVTVSSDIGDDDLILKCEDEIVSQRCAGWTRRSGGCVTIEEFPEGTWHADIEFTRAAKDVLP